MKKFGVLLLVVLVAMSLSACSAFYDETTKDYPADEPLEMAVFLQVKDIANFSAAKLADWNAALQSAITQTAHDNDPAAVKITAAKLREINDEALHDTYTVDLTLTNVPATTVQRTVRPFKIYIKQTTFNPISLLPASDTFTYVVGYTSERRHSAVNTEWVETQDDGTYAYLWTTGDAIEFTNVYPNRPLYYVLVFVGAVALGVVVYCVARYKAKRELLPQ